MRVALLLGLLCSLWGAINRAPTWESRSGGKRKKPTKSTSARHDAMGIPTRRGASGGGLGGGPCGRPRRRLLSNIFLGSPGLAHGTHKGCHYISAALHTTVYCTYIV